MSCAKSQKFIIVLFASIASAIGQSATDSNAILGFETPLAWAVSGNNATIPTESSTTTRTQGRFALAVNTPSNLTKLASMPVTSGAPALAGIGTPGASFEVDVMLPAQQGNPNNTGQLQLLLDSRTCGIGNVNIGSVSFAGLRTGLYQTMKLPIPDAIRSSLGSCSFHDLTFQFLISSPGIITGTYLFDNLRVHSAVVVPVANASTRPPAGYGGSVDFVVIGNTPVSQLFDAGPLQVPARFHLKLGNAGSTKVELDIGYDGTPSFTCIYDADTADPAGKSYRLGFCTQGMLAGDLVGASWAQLTITGGDSTVKLRAQLARRPVGDLIGGGIIPPLPTFWGDFDGCIPAPAAGQVVTTSTSCANQAAQANQIITTYFNTLNMSKPPSDWIVAPVPEFALRHGNGAPHNNLTGPPPPGDPPFDQEGHLNPGGDFDAYWQLSGNLTPRNIQGTDRTLTDFDAAFSAHIVLFGEDVDVLKVGTQIHADSGQTTPLPPSPIPPSSSGSADLFLFGKEIPKGGYSADASTGFNINPDPLTADFNLPPIPVWIFEITIGATASVGLKLNGGLAPSGFDISLIPFASAGAHIEGSINLGIASGGVDARIDLLEVSTPVTAQAKWVLNTSPTVCAVHVIGSLNGQAQIGSGGGEIDLVASFFFYDVSLTLFKWDPLISYTLPLFNFQLDESLFPLPASACTAPLTVTISSPAPGASLQAGRSWTFAGQASGNGGPVECSNLTWSLSPVVAGDTLSPTTGCNVTATFAQPQSLAEPRTVKLHAAKLYTSVAGPILETGDAQVDITVTPLPPGDYIRTITTPDCPGTICGMNAGFAKTYNFCNSTTSLGGDPVTACTDSLGIQPAPLGTYTISGFVSGSSGEMCTTWSVTDPFGAPLMVHPTSPASDLISSAQWTANTFGQYTITMTTTAGTCGNGGPQFGTATVKVSLSPLR